MRKILCFCALFFTLIVTACQQAEKKLPILGERKAIIRQVNGKDVTDTLYHTIPAFHFINQDSRLVTEHTFAGKVYVADFFFTTCPTICPKMRTQMLKIFEKYKENPEVMLLSHTINPGHDSVPVLKEYAESIGVSSDKWHFVTGEKQKIYEIGQNSYRVKTISDDKAGGFMHSGAFILVDKQRRIRGLYDGTVPEQVDQLLEDMDVLLAKSE
jgi:protein SCO1/2